MCLIARRKAWKLRKPRTMYKVFHLQLWVDRYGFITPYWGSCTIPTGIMEAKLDGHTNLKGERVYSIGIHGFVNLKDAMEEAHYHNEINSLCLLRKEYVIVPCSVPKGSMYCEGDFFNTKSNVADFVNVGQDVYNANGEFMFKLNMHGKVINETDPQ